MADKRFGYFSAQGLRFCEICKAFPQAQSHQVVPAYWPKLFAGELRRTSYG